MNFFFRKKAITWYAKGDLQKINSYFSFTNMRKDIK